MQIVDLQPLALGPVQIFDLQSCVPRTNLRYVQIRQIRDLPLHRFASEQIFDLYPVQIFLHRRCTCSGYKSSCPEGALVRQRYESSFACFDLYPNKCTYGARRFVPPSGKGKKSSPKVSALVRLQIEDLIPKGFLCIASAFGIQIKDLYATLPLALAQSGPRSGGCKSSCTSSTCKS